MRNHSTCTTRLDWALWAAERGWPVFRVKRNAKAPAFKGWQAEATTDEHRIKKLWGNGEFNIGIACGGGLLALDLDTKNGNDGPTTAKLMFDLDQDSTFAVRTISGGSHLYMTGPNLPNSAGKIAPGVDMRSAGGFVVAPGSEIDGRAYTILNDAPLAEAPAELIRFAGAPSQRTGSDPGRAGLLVADFEEDQPANIEVARMWLETRAPAIQGLGGDAHTYETACRLRDFGLSEDAAADLMASSWNERCAPPWSADELRVKVANAFAYATGPAGGKSPVRLFEGVHVEPEAAKPASPWHDHGDNYVGAVSWLYEGILPQTGTVILSGASGSGKTFIALYLAKSLATGGEFFKLPPAVTGATLLLIGEAFGSVKMRLAALGEADERLPISARYVGGLAARGMWKALCDDVRAKAATMAQPVRLIVLDTLSSSNILEREDDNGQAAAVMKLFSELAVELNLLFVVIHHPPKSGLGERGAGAIRNNADYVITVSQKPNESLREIETTKSRDGECKALGTFTLLSVQIEDGTTMVVSPGEPRIKLGRNGRAASSGKSDRFQKLFDEVHTAEPQTVDGRRAVKTESIRAAIASGMAKPDKSNVRRRIREAIESGRFEAVEASGIRYLVERSLFGTAKLSCQPLLKWGAD